MAGKKVKLRPKGSSLIEVVIAMVVIVLVFIIALMIVANVTRSSLNLTKAEAEKILDKAIDDAEQSNELSSAKKTYDLDGLTISQKIIPYKRNPALAEIQLLALNEKGDTVLMARKVLINE